MREGYTLVYIPSLVHPSRYTLPYTASLYTTVVPLCTELTCGDDSYSREVEGERGNEAKSALPPSQE